MGNVRNTVAYFKKEVTPGVAVLPTSSTDGFVSIEKPDVTTGQRELLESDQLSGNIGVKKPQLGIETASASVVLEMRSHGDSVTPTEPDFGQLIESAIGTPVISVVDAVQATPAPSASEFGILTEGNVKKYDFMIIGNATDGRVPRFAASLKLDVVVGVNDKLDFDDGGGEENATLTPGTYIHGSSDVVGSIGEEIKSVMDALSGDVNTVVAVLNPDGSYTYTISSDGATLELLIATGAGNATAFLELNLGFGSADLMGAVTYTAATDVWGNRVVCNTPMTSAPTAADVVYPTVNYKPINESHEHFTSGFYQGNSSVDGYLEQVLGSLVSSFGMSIETAGICKFNFDITGLSSARAATTAAPYDPSYEDVQGLVGLNVLAYLDDTLVCGNSISLAAEDDIGEQKTYCTASGKSGSIVRKRTITGSINPYADGEIDYYTALNALTDYKFMIVIGKKDAGGFIVGETVGIYLPQTMITQDKTSDVDDIMTEDINFSAHTGASGNLTDMVVSFG